MDPIEAAFRDIREQYRYAVDAYRIARNPAKSIYFLREAIRKTTNVMFELANRPGGRDGFE